MDELLKLADDCYAKARAISNFAKKAELMNMGDQYVKQAEANRYSAQKSGCKIG